MPYNKKKNAIPDRWTDYKAVGKRMLGTRFVAFKVPLKQSLRNRLSPSEAFGPDDLLQVLEEEKQQLGLIIDLTFTTRYYSPGDLPRSVNYIKIFTAGHEVPSDSTILSFKRVVRRFLRENEDNDKLIGVHCTHGLNRTGYLVCRYLIDVNGIEPGEAIKLFNTSRGHNIERQNYISDLQKGPKRSNEGMEEPGEEPTQGGRPQMPPSNHPNQGPMNQRNNRPPTRDDRWVPQDHYGPPPDWEMMQRLGPEPNPPSWFFAPSGFIGERPPFARPPYMHGPNAGGDWDMWRPPHPQPYYPYLPYPRWQPQESQYQFRNRDRDRHQFRNQNRDRFRDQDRDRHRDRSCDRDRDRHRDRSRDRDRDRERDRSRERDRDRDRDRD